MPRITVWTAFFVLVVAGIAAPTSTPGQVEFRTINGQGNNETNTSWGQAGTSLPRIRDVIVNPPANLDLLAPHYDDAAGLDSPRSTAVGGGMLPNPRDISNAVSAQGNVNLPNSKGASDWLWQWGQFLDHDITQVDAGPAPEFSPIAVSPMDSATGQADPLFPMIPFSRTGAASGTGAGTTVPRGQTNALTSYIDGSQVYGSDATREDFLRTKDGTGQLKMTTAANGESLLPMNRAVDPFPNANPPTAPGVTPPPPEELFLAGDVRSNEQVGLLATHTLFVREHNYQAQQLVAQHTPSELMQMATDAGLTDVGEFLYQAARRAVGAEIQAITFNEFLPMLLGPDPLPAYTGYQPTVNAAVSNEFATAAYRVGHTLLSPELLLVGNGHQLLDTIALRDAFFNPDYVKQHGVDKILMGLTFGSAQEIDPMVVDDVRNFLFDDSIGGLDLAAVNINRGRDHGLPTYNDMREGLGLSRQVDFSQITSDPDIASKLDSVYSSVDDVDLWVGALAEDPHHGGMVGELLYVILADQFMRFRDGDRFFYLDDSFLEDLFPGIDQTTLSEVVMRNSGMTTMSSSAFLQSQVVPEPQSLALLALGLVSFSLTRRPRRRRRG